MRGLLESQKVRPFNIYTFLLNSIKIDLIFFKCDVSCRDGRLKDRPCATAASSHSPNNFASHHLVLISTGSDKLFKLSVLIVLIEI